MIIGALIGFLLFAAVFIGLFVYAENNNVTLQPDGKTVMWAATSAAVGALFGALF